MNEEQATFVFHGSTFNKQKDQKRLGAQMLKVRNLMADGQWRTLSEIAVKTGSPQQSISARLRDLRKPQFGSLKVDRRHVSGGLYEYRVTASQCPPMTSL